MKFCPKCGSLTILDNGICANCGEVVSDVNQEHSQNAFVSQPIEQLTPMVEQSQVVSVTTSNPEIPTLSTPPQSVATPTIALDSVTLGTDTELQSIPDTNDSLMISAASVIENETVVETQPTVPIAESQELIEPEPSQIIESVPSTESELVVEKVQDSSKDDRKVKKEVIILTPEEKEKKFNRIITISVIVVSLIAIVVTSTFMLNALSKQETKNENMVTTTTEYSYEGFKFFLPNDVLGSIEEGSFVIKDTDNTWSAVITIQDGAYNSLVSNKSQISGYFETFGYVSGAVEEKEVSGTSFVTTEILVGSKNVLVAYAKASGTKLYGILYTNELGTYDDYSLKVVGEILSSTINSGYDTSIPEGLTIDMFKQTFEVAK